MKKESEKFKTGKDENIFNLSYLVLGVLIFLTLGVTYNFYRSAHNKDMLRFANQVNRLTSSIDNRIKLYRAMLKGGRGFVETSKDLNRRDFAVYVGSLDLPNRYPGIQGIGFSRYFPAAEKENVIKKAKSEGFEDFKIFPEGDRPFYTSIIYIEPMVERNRVALGFDMFSESVRREAMERARDSDDAATSGKVTLLEENGGSGVAGFLIYLPIYENGQMPNLLEEKKAKLRGFIYSPFRADDFLNEIYDSVPDQDIQIQIYDQQLQPENLLAQTKEKSNTNVLGFMDQKYFGKQEVDVGGRKWTVQFTTLPDFAAQSSIGWTPLILLCGIGFSFLLFGMTYWEAASRAKVQKTAAELIELQKEKEQLFEDEKKARVAAEEANLTKDEFISIVSHELKTPLNAIAGWTRILKTGDISGQTKDLALQKIDKNLRTQVNLIEQLLNYSEIISGRTKFNGQKVDFSDLFEQACAEIEKTAKEKNLEFVKRNTLESHFISGEREKLKIVLDNLFLNAVKFTQSGGRIEADVKESGGFIEMKISDNGRGISPEFLPHVFEHYKQADTPNTRDYGGLGLGLTIAKHIVALHDGQIYAESGGKNKGAVFTVKVPINNAFGK